MGEITIGQLIAAFVAAMGIPSAIMGLLVWNFERKIQKRDKRKDEEEAALRKEAEEREKAREKMELLLVQGTNAAIALGEATARAVQRIPDAHCNGDMHAALDYAAEVKHNQKDFLTEQGIKAIRV